MLLDGYYFQQDTMGMDVTPGTVTIKKDETSKLIGISTGGGEPRCPCVYVVEVFANTPAAKDGSLRSGDELVAINGVPVSGKTLIQVSQMIRASSGEVRISYNKLHADPKQGKSLDILLKKVKHRMVDSMNSATANFLGLSRAVLTHDTILEKVQDVERTEKMYRGIIQRADGVLEAHSNLVKAYKEFGDVFSAIGVHEPHPSASEAYRLLGDIHRRMEKSGLEVIESIRPMLYEFGTYLNKVIPDTKLTLRKYADTKFEYLSYCLKVKELDDAASYCASFNELTYEEVTGNYEYRLILRCREDAKERFRCLRADVLEKIRLLDNKHAEGVVKQLQRLVLGLSRLQTDTLELLQGRTVFPIDIDLCHSVLQHYLQD